MEILGFALRPKAIIDNPTDAELRQMALNQGGIITQFGNIALITRIRSRSAKFTEIILRDLNQAERELLGQVFDAIRTKVMIQLDRTMCMNPGFKIACRIYVDAEYARLPLMWGNTLFPSEEKDPEFVTIVLPDWPDRRVLVFPESGLTIVLGSDYKGEIKKSMLRKLMYQVKKQGCLGLHAGSKILQIRRDGNLRDVGFLFFGLSGTGKTTLSCHSHWLRYPERVIIRQDDVVVLQPDGRCVGTEDSYYIKTDGLEPDTQPLLYAASISPRAILENVKVHPNGKVDFFDQSLTSNGRAMVKRSDVAFTDDRIDLDKVDNIIFITRRYDIVPPIARLSPEWAAAAFMLGESIETSAGDPEQAGKSKRVVGTNPFIIGSEAEEGNRFLEIMRNNPDIQCFLLNTGWVGGERSGVKISIKDSVKIIEMIARGEIRWREDPIWGYEIPAEIPGIDMSRFDLENHYTKDRLQEVATLLREERREWLKQFKGLDPAILKLFD
ncbi:MAG TPA: phosphoenolpyruvate carboxykinase (ATP) [Candidatus Latescibacteria bacterium]|nr:phosphoenolpyruvate carboxykinase (ATP) [Candidatus Latescibacterota bacterium]